MAKLYQHKRFGWMIRYTIYFSNGQEKIKYRFFHNKLRVQGALQDIEGLEHRSLKNTLSRDDLLYYLRCRYLSRTEADMLMGRAVVVPTLGELAQEFLARSEIECRPRSHTTNISRINNLLTFFGSNCPAADITTEKIDIYRAHRLKAVTAVTVNKEIIKLAQFLDIALARGAISGNVARTIRRLKDGRERKPRALTKGEIILLIETAKIERQLLRGMAYPIIMTYLYTGMRREELVWLEWEDIDLLKRRIIIQSKAGKGEFMTKTGGSRSVGISSKLAEILQGLRHDGRYCFGATQLGQPLLHGDGITHAFQKLVKRAGLPGTITLHSLRHTYITHLMEAGVNPRRVQELAGHKVFSTTWRYAHALPSDGIEEDRLDF